MGTAVLHAQEYFAVPRGDPNSHFSPLADYPPPTASPNGEARVLALEASPSVMRYGRNAALCGKFHSKGGSSLSRNSSAAEFLPSPGRVRSSAHNAYRRLVPRNPTCGFSEIACSSYDKKHFLPPHLSSQESEVLISRQFSVPMWDHAARTHSILSERLPLLRGQAHESRPPQGFARSPSNLAQNMLSRSCKTAASCQQLKPLASPHFQDVLCLKRADSFNPSAQYRKRLHPEVSQVEARLEKQSAKPSLKIFADGPERSICTNMGIVANKFSGNTKRLSRSVSEKALEMSETRSVQMPADKVGVKMATSLSDGAVGAHTGKNGSGKSVLKLISSEPGASLLRQQCGDVDAAMDHKDAIEGDMAATNGLGLQVKTGVGSVSMTSTWYDSAGSRTGRLETHCSEGGLETDGLWVSMMNGEKWAGPSFVNSPPPSSLPVPSFTILLSRVPSAGSKALNSAGGSGARMVPDNSSLQASSRMWDAVVATKDLRRMLNLDKTAVEV